IICLSTVPFFFFTDTPTTELYTLSLHDALPILRLAGPEGLTAEVSSFRRQDAVEAIAEIAGASMTAGEVDALAGEFVASPHVRALAAGPGQPGSGLWRRDGTRERAPDHAIYTTPELLALEAQ